MIKRFFSCFVIAALMFGCKQTPNEADISTIEINTNFLRFDSAFFEIDTSKFVEGIDDLKQTYPPFFSSGGTLRFWKLQRTDGRQIELYKTVKETFTPFQSYNQELNLGMKRLLYYFPDQKPIKFYSYISNLDLSLPVLYVDSANYCFVGSDLYLGQNSGYYDYIPSYLSYYREPKFMVRDCLESILANNTLLPTSDATLLEHMVYHGKQLYALQRLFPEKSESFIIKYQSDKMSFCLENEKSIWAYFVENQLLFSKKMENIRHFISVAPFSRFGMKFDNQSPGRIGQWVGLQIVKAYMAKNADIAIKDLLYEKDARKILHQSGYKPQ